MRTTISVLEAADRDVEAILSLEDASGAASSVSLTRGLALREALARGHWIAIAVEGDATASEMRADTRLAGWIWFSLELGRDGQYAGQIVRLAANDPAAAAGLFDYARDVLGRRGAAVVRTTLDAGDEWGFGVFEALGFTRSSVSMEIEL